MTSASSVVRAVPLLPRDGVEPVSAKTGRGALAPPGWDGGVLVLEAVVTSFIPLLHLLLRATSGAFPAVGTVAPSIVQREFFHAQRFGCPFGMYGVSLLPRGADASEERAVVVVVLLACPCIRGRAGAAT